MKVSEGKFGQKNNVLKKQKMFWQLSVLNFLESFRFLLVILSFVLLITVYFIIHLIFNWKEDPIFYDFDFAISMIFITEILVRLYCYGVVNQGVAGFFSSPFHLLDISVMSIDVILIILSNELSRNHAFSKSLP
jgi:hypothetical protein